MKNKYYALVKFGNNKYGIRDKSWVSSKYYMVITKKKYLFPTSYSDENPYEIKRLCQVSYDKAVEHFCYLTKKKLDLVANEKKCKLEISEKKLNCFFLKRQLKNIVKKQMALTNIQLQYKIIVLGDENENLRNQIKELENVGRK